MTHTTHTKPTPKAHNKDADKEPKVNPAPEAREATSEAPAPLGDIKPAAPGTTIVVNDKTFKTEDGVTHTMTGKAIAALLGMDGERVVQRMNRVQTAIGREENVVIADGDVFNVR